MQVFTGLQYVTARASVTAMMPVCGGSVRSQSAAILRVLPVFRRGFQSLIDYAAVFFPRRPAGESLVPPPNVCSGWSRANRKREAVNAFSLNAGKRFQRAQHDYRWRCNERRDTFARW